MEPLKRYYLDLFSGIGGFALGAFWAGIKFNAHYFSEVDPYAISIYKKRFPEAMPLGDIRKIDGTKLPKGNWILSGGFPCQDISIAGKGAGLDGNRSGLWYEYARLISEIRPAFAIVENVGAITFRGLSRVLGSLSAIGYDAEWQDIRASDLEAPHKRERIWILAYPEGGGFTGHHAIQNNNQIIKTRGGDHEDRNHITEWGEEDGFVKCVGPHFSEKGNDDSMSIGNRDCFQGIKNKWASEPDIYRVAHGIPFGMDRLRCLGNAIVPEIAMMIWLQIKLYFDGGFNVT